MGAIRRALIATTAVGIISVVGLGSAGLGSAGADPSNTSLMPVVYANAAPPTIAAARRFSYGASAANLGQHGATMSAMGLTHLKAHLSWATSEPAPGQYQWLTAPGANDANNIATVAEQYGFDLTIRVDRAPDWAATGTGGARPPADPETFGNFMGALATYLKGRVVAYEIWNEPNLSYEWGNLPPSPENFAELLKAAYPKIKAADPDALVVTGGVASTGGDGGVTVLDDVEFLRRMYAAGAKGSFDALGSHPYGFANSPTTRNSNNVTDFFRAADHYQVMVENGDGHKAVWATEFGWLLDPADYGRPELLDDPLWFGRHWQRTSPETQAQYLVEAYEYARDNWPWMGAMFLFNLDYSTTPWYPDADPIRWYSIFDGDGSPRPAYQAIRDMPKPSR